jgi:hypothetical protein
MFELNFRDERYLPFGFAGAVSRWRIELPQDNNQFDLETVSDPCSTSTTPPGKGGEVLRRAANEVAQCKLPAAGMRYFDVEHDMPELWQDLRGHHHTDDDGSRPETLPCGSAGEYSRSYQESKRSGWSGSSCSSKRAEQFRATTMSFASTSPTMTATAHHGRFTVSPAPTARRSITAPSIQVAFHPSARTTSSGGTDSAAWSSLAP